MLSAYPACFIQESNGYSVIFPDLNWLSTCGTTLEDALKMSVECLAGHLYFCSKSGTPVPEPSAPNQLDINAILQELNITSEAAFINMVTVDVHEYAKLHFEKSVKKTLTIPAWLNQLALEQNINFSQVLQEALKTKLHLR